MSYDSDNGWVIPVGLIIIFMITVTVVIAVKISEKKECTCELPKNGVMYNIVDSKGNVIKQVSKSELKQIK